jgi:hypothetical protein
MLSLVNHKVAFLFNLFKSDLSNLFKDCNYLFYADDRKLYKKIKSHSDRDVLQTNLNVLNDWCTDNGMELNIKNVMSERFQNYIIL